MQVYTWSNVKGPVATHTQKSACAKTLIMHAYQACSYMCSHLKSNQSRLPKISQMRQAKKFI
ncbi:hypothetical protein ABEB36_013084 [Hypothenemus hampei]|uniref:Uncharacterized protein n=1 Tax=Hypothenemus hampei TaxID=57062 RepID=A0ABD1E7L6_HYPHA